MTKLEEITEKTQTIRKKINAFEKLRSVCVRFSVHYYRDGNSLMNAVMMVRIAKVKSILNDLYSEIIPVERERLSLLTQEPKAVTHEIVNLNIKHYESWMH